MFSKPFLGTLINVNWGSTDPPRLLPKTQNRREPEVRTSEIPTIMGLDSTKELPKPQSILTNISGNSAASRNE